MPTNLELKARYPSAERASDIATTFIKREPDVLLQIDTYYGVREGRLKLREFGLNGAELIYYHRGNQKAERISEYSIIPVHDAAGVKELLHSRLGRRIVVDKKRLVFLYENARIHIDVVKDLGTFVEFEVLVTKGTRQAHRLIRFLCDKFEIRNDQLVGVSYSDLLLGNVSEACRENCQSTHQLNEEP